MAVSAHTHSLTHSAHQAHLDEFLRLFRYTLGRQPHDDEHRTSGHDGDSCTDSRPSTTRRRTRDMHGTDNGTQYGTLSKKGQGLCASRLRRRTRDLSYENELASLEIGLRMSRKKTSGLSRQLSSEKDYCRARSILQKLDQIAIDTMTHMLRCSLRDARDSRLGAMSY